MLSCAGDLDGAAVDALRRSLIDMIARRPDRLIVDLNAVPSIDAAAIAELVRARIELQASGGELVLHGPHDGDDRFLAVVRLADREPDRSDRSDVSTGSVVARWEAACATEPFGATPLLFPDPNALVSTISSLVDNLDDDLDGLPSAATDLSSLVGSMDESNPSIAVLQLLALSSVLRATPEVAARESDGAGSRAGADVDIAVSTLVASTLAHLEHAILLDPLTGLLNRRALDRDLVEAIATARRAGHRLMVVMIDVDGLKDINDRIGHRAGDDTLRDLATRLTAACRAGDHAYRIGGDEFVLVLPDLGVEDIDGVMARIARSAAGTFSWGCAWAEVGEVPPSDRRRAAELLDLADRRMIDHRAVTRGHSRPDRQGTAANLVVAQLAEAERSVVVVEQAKGLIAERFDLTIADAALTLDRSARQLGMDLGALATGLVDRTLDVALVAVPAGADQLTSGTETSPRG